MAKRNFKTGKRKKSLGVPAGYREMWGYRGVWDERKLHKGLWKIDFRATKKRRSGSYGSFGRGTKGRWKINAIQDIIKTGKGKYQTRLRGFKRPVYFKVRRKRK